ncbi:MAG: sialidase [Roseburia sp.]|nr:sialidase [Roseburia sp.]
MKRYLARVLGIVLLASIVGLSGCGMNIGRQNEKITDFHNELLGENVYIFSPEDDPALVNEVLADLYEKQEENQFGKSRYAIYFMPGIYDESIEVNVGYYMQVAGLGVLPTDTRIPSLQCTAEWLGDDPNNHNACCNFWRGVENIELGSNTMWAVSQATFMRRVQVDGALYLHDNYGWCSGGFLADSNTELMTDSGSQQQWLSRNCSWKAWMGENWNMVFVGTEEGENPRGTWPAVPYTTVETTEKIQEKPFLIYDEENGYQVFVPEVRENAMGVSWEDGAHGEALPISDFYVAKADVDTAETINAALTEGKHLLLTPGIYELDEPIRIEKEGTIVLGMGLATLQSVDGSTCMETADVNGLIIAGLLFDAGEVMSENLLVVGDTEHGNAGEAEGFISLSDVFFRVGGTVTAEPTQAECCITINSDDVVGDNLWVWRADHGDQVAWDKNVTKNGIIVNGDDVTVYALMVEHFHEYQTIWNGENGKVYMYQSEIPYDVPNQSVWMSHDGEMEGYASFYVDENVQKFEAWGLGIYLYNRDAMVVLNTAMEVPDREGVKVHHICTVMLNGYPGMRHIINDCGGDVAYAVEREIICEYEAGIIK